MKDDLVFITFEDQLALKDPRYDNLVVCKTCAKDRAGLDCHDNPDGTLECTGGIYLYQWEVEELQDRVSPETPRRNND